MFWCRAFLLNPLKKLGIDISDFEEASANRKISTKAHVLERLLGCLVVAQSQKIADPVTFMQFSGKICEFGRRIKRFMTASLYERVCRWTPCARSVATATGWSQ